MAVTDELTAGYGACTTTAGLVDRSELGKLLLRGEQAAEFLDGQVSNDIGALAPGEGCLATLLTPKGKMLGDLRVLRAPNDSLLLICERMALQGLFDRMRRGLIGWRAELHKRTLELGLWSVIGPRADAIVREAGRPLPDATEHALASSGDELVVRTDVGIDLLMPAEHGAQLRDAIVAAGAMPVPEEVAEIVRVERGRPRYGIDLDDSVMPEEAGLEQRAVSFTKGCYVGQETVARLHWKGKPNRHLRGLRPSGPVLAGDVLHQGDREVGRVGSAVVSPRLGPLALALVRREVEPGSTVAVGHGAATAAVVALPFE